MNSPVGLGLFTRRGEGSPNFIWRRASTETNLGSILLQCRVGVGLGGPAP